MLLTVPTLQRKVLVNLKIESARNQRLGIYCCDRARPQTFYSKLVCDLYKPEHSIDLQFPQSPHTLAIWLVDDDTGADPAVRVKHRNIQRLKTQQHLLSHKTRARLPFLMDFARDARYLPGDQKISSGRQVIYYYRDFIENPDGSIEDTPARVDDAKGEIDVSKAAIKPCSVFSLTFILTHEDAHFHENEEFYDEFEADKNGLKTYLYSGHPYDQAMYAFTKIFTENSQNRDRTERLYAYIEEFRETGRIT